MTRKLFGVRSAMRMVSQNKGDAMSQENNLRFLLNRYKKEIIDFTNHPSHEGFVVLGNLEEDIVKFHTGHEEVIYNWGVEKPPHPYTRVV